jgi:hypothetical protein
MLQGLAGNEVLALILLAQQLGEGIQAIQCSTWNIEAPTRFLLVHQAARLRQ